MDVAELVLEYIKALVWPTVAGLALFWFRVEISSLLGRVKAARGMGFELDIAEKQVEQIQATLTDETQPAEARLATARGSAAELLELLRAEEAGQKARVWTAWSARNNDAHIY